jgi:hypothetical protein
MDARLQRCDQANVEGMREIGANEVGAASDQGHPARGGQLTNRSGQKDEDQ